MSEPVTVPTAPALSRVANVELIHTGTWDVSNGTWTVTTEDLVDAVAALDCPAVRRPVLKIGHDDPRFDGEPAVGYVDNMGVVDAGRMLVGDYAGMPGWLATPDADGQTVLASAWADRSIEGQYDFRCQLGHIHPFVVTAVALLGVESPGVGTLQSLQDVGRLYGVDLPEQVAASAAQDEQPTTGVPVRLTIASREDTTMPRPVPNTVAASVTSEDVRRAFYDAEIGSSWWLWIEEIQLAPVLQVIYVDDETGDRYRVEVTVGAGDGADAVTFGEPVQVVIRYEDATAVAASARTAVRYATRDASRPRGTDQVAASTQTSAAVSDGPTQEGSPAVAFSDEQLTALRQQVGVPEDADEATILAALTEALTERADPQVITAPTLPEGVVTIDADQLEQLRVAAGAGVEARQRQVREDRERAVAAALGDGRISAARRQHWLDLIEKDPGELATLEGLAKNTVPVAAAGHAANEVADDPRQSAAYKNWSM